MVSAPDFQTQNRRFEPERLMKKCPAQAMSDDSAALVHSAVNDYLKIRQGWQLYLDYPWCLEACWASATY